MTLSHTVVMDTESTGSRGTISPAHSPSTVDRRSGAGRSCVSPMHIAGP